jgi:phosphatidylglycerophosphatase A
MIQLHNWFASCFGIGRVKGGGTITAILCCIGWWWLKKTGATDNILLIITSLVTILGVWSATMVEPHWGKDSSKVVIDEAAGMLVSLLFIPATLVYLLVALALFRFFDILKPLFIRRMEAFPGGWGVMADDVLAGIYSNIVLQLLIYYNIAGR